MKELTIEEKAKAYDKALERAKECHIDGLSLHQPVKEVIEHIFPELKESEDEKIRKALIEMVHDTTGDELWVDYGIHKEEALAWLEAQGEQKPAEFDDTNAKRMFIKALERVEEQDNKGYKLTDCDKNSWWEDFKAYTSCIIEQKPADKVELKFKVGDYVVGKYISGYISEVRDDCYLLDYQGFPIDKQDNYHLWTIHDAKEGDVLISKGELKYSNGIKYERICLFNNLDKAFFTLVKTSNNIETYDIDVNIDYPDNTVPATKEQREILFMAMTDAGYTFDFEKKKLKKIEK